VAKYGFEFKRKVVQEYLDGKGGFQTIAKQYNIKIGELRKYLLHHLKMVILALISYFLILILK
jgi:transposase